MFLLVSSFIWRTHQRSKVSQRLNLAQQPVYMSALTSLLPMPLCVRRRRESLAYYRIANHYKWAFQQLFECFQYERVIVVEDDMVFAPDFFSYFEATSRILDQVWSQDEPAASCKLTIITEPNEKARSAVLCRDHELRSSRAPCWAQWC